MQDQHDTTLTGFYKEALAKARAYLEKTYQIEDGLDRDASAQHVSRLNEGSTVWRIKANGTERSFTFLVAIPHTFPDKPPKFYLTEGDSRAFDRVPHVDKNRLVCTRDSSVVVLNDAQPGEAIDKLLRIAVSILEAGLRDELKQDFEEEFLAYWNNDEESKTLSIGTPSTAPNKGFQYALSAQLFSATYLIAPAKAFATTWLNHLGVARLLHNETDVLYLHLPSVPESLPSTNRDIITLFADLDAESRRAVNNFRGNIILASVVSGNDRMLFSWRHPLVRVKGFRQKKGAIPLGLSMRGVQDQKIIKFSIKRMDRDRIVRRSVDMSMLIKEDCSLAIVGCGSVGSTLAMLLAKSGCQKFTLIDDEDLTEENVARHLCGCHEVATIQSKVGAVKQTLERHLPYVICDARKSDVLDLLIKAPEIFSVAQLVIFSTANMAAERRANEFFHTDIPKPVVYLWIEPFGVGGQILYISPESGSCYRCCFDSNGDFRFAVAASGQQFGRREAGCQTTFTPYGAADLEIFCAIACKEIIRIIQKSPERSALTTWIGDKGQFESAGFKISDAYAAHESYSLHRREVPRQLSCERCK